MTHSFRRGARELEALAARSPSPPDVVDALRRLGQILREIADLQREPLSDAELERLIDLLVDDAGASQDEIRDDLRAYGISWVDVEELTNVVIEEARRRRTPPGGDMIFRKTFDKNKYDFRDARCFEADCFAPGVYQTRGATASGSRATGRSSPCCMRRAYHGCPNDVVYLPSLAEARKKEGWKKPR